MGGLSFHSSNFTDFSIDQTAAILAKLGFDAIELNLETAEPDFRAHLTPDIPHVEREDIVGVLDRTGLHLSSLSAHCDMIESDPTKYDRALKYVFDTIDLANDLGTDIVHIASGMITPEAGMEACWNRMTESARRCIDHGRERGVRVGIEAGVFPGLIVWNTASMLELIDRVGYDDLYVNFDPSHFQPAGDDAVESYRALSDRIIHIHAKDGSGTRDAFEFPPLGKGDVDWISLQTAMIDTGYQGYVSVEYEAHFFAKGYPKDPIGSAKQSKRFLDEFLADWLRVVRPPVDV